MKRQYPRKCLECKVKFTPNKPNQVVCSPYCSIKYAKTKAEKDKKKVRSEMKEKLKSKSEHLNELQKVFNKYIRLRDADKPCISCGTTAPVKYDAGHFFSVGAYPNLRFNEDNVHKQCSNYCNKNMHGNYHAYRFWLIERIGLERLDELDRLKNIPLKLSIEETKELKQKYSQLIKKLSSSGQ